MPLFSLKGSLHLAASYYRNPLYYYHYYRHHPLYPECRYQNAPLHRAVAGPVRAEWQGCHIYADHFFAGRLHPLPVISPSLTGTPLEPIACSGCGLRPVGPLFGSKSDRVLPPAMCLSRHERQSSYLTTDMGLQVLPGIPRGARVYLACPADPASPEARYRVAETQIILIINVLLDRPAGTLPTNMRAPMSTQNLSGNYNGNGYRACRKPASLSYGYADSTALPLARRARMMARPPRVFMRARKPCVRARLILEG